MRVCIVMGRAGSSGGILKSSTLFSLLSRCSSSTGIALYKFLPAMSLNADIGRSTSEGLLRESAAFFLRLGCSICARQFVAM